jgi:hypothetical protein
MSWVSKAWLKAGPWAIVMSCIAPPALAAGIPLTAWAPADGAQASKMMWLQSPCGATTIGSSGVFRLGVVRSPGGRTNKRIARWAPQYLADNDAVALDFGLVEGPLARMPSAGPSCSEGVPPSPQAAALLPPLREAAPPEGPRSFIAAAPPPASQRGGGHDEDSGTASDPPPPAPPAPPTGTQGPFEPSDIGGGSDASLLGLSSGGDLAPPPSPAGAGEADRHVFRGQVAEPSTAWLLGIGLLGLVRLRRAR